MKRAILLASLVAGLWLPAAAPASDSKFAQHVTLRAERLLVLNLVGELRVAGHEGDAFEIDVIGRGEDARSEDFEIITVEGEEAELFVALPFEGEPRFRYPELGKGSSTSMTVDQGGEANSRLEARLASRGARRVKVSGGDGVEIWADLVVRVPAGRRLEVEIGVGQLEVDNVEGTLELSALSGHVFTRGVIGGLSVSTGSGHVDVERVDGRVRIDTGSGHVKLVDCDAPVLRVDTGSGHVELTRVESDEVDIDSGSGHVIASDLGADRVSIDTASGRVDVGFRWIGEGPFELVTASGAIELKLPAGASAMIDASTSSGGVRVDLPEAEILTSARDEARLRVGDGRAQMRLRTASGRVRISG